MTCARYGCANPVNKMNGKYCSAQCAPYGHLSGRGSGVTRSASRTARSSSQARGAELARSLNEERATAIAQALAEQKAKNAALLGRSEVPNTKPLAMPSKLNVEEEKEEMLIGNDGTNGIERTEPTIVEKSELESGTEIQPEASLQLPINLDEERSRSMSLIDESAKHLLAYMKSLGSDVRDRPVLVDFRQINAVANLGKQIAQLAKVKLDAIKEARK